MALPTYWLFPWIDRRNLCFVNINNDGLVVQQKQIIRQKRRNLKYIAAFLSYSSSSRKSLTGESPISCQPNVYPAQ